MANVKKISVREYARRLSVDEKAVRQAITKGLITSKSYDAKLKKINPVAANREWGHLHKVVKPRGGVSRVKAIEKLEGVAPPDLPGGALFEAETLNDLLAGIRIHSKMPANESMRVREIIGAALDKKKLEEAEGRLVDRAKVERTLFAISNELKKALFNMPQRIVRDIMAAPSEVEAINIFNDELTVVLNDFINIKPDFTIG